MDGSLWHKCSQANYVADREPQRIAVITDIATAIAIVTHTWLDVRSAPAGGARRTSA